MHHQASTGRKGESKSYTLRTTCCQMLRSLRSERGFSSTSAAPTSMPRHTSSVLLPFSDMSTTGRCEADCLRGPQCLASLATAWACSCRGTQYAICHEAFSCKRAFRARYWRSQELSRDPSRDAPASPKVQPRVRRSFSALLSDSPNGGPANMKCCHCTDEPIRALIFHLSPARGAATPHRNVGRLVGLTTIVSQDIHKPALHQGWPHPRAAR